MQKSSVARISIEISFDVKELCKHILANGHIGFNSSPICFVLGFKIFHPTDDISSNPNLKETVGMCLLGGIWLRPIDSFEITLCLFIHRKDKYFFIEESRLEMTVE